MNIKKIIIILSILFINIEVANASTKVEAKLYKCVDGDTAWFIVNNENVKARFLAIDTPESTTTIEEYGKEASEFTCNALTNAEKIILEYDDNSDKIDKYDRELIWVWTDDKLLQEELLKNGLAEIKYLYGDYDYTDHLKEIEEQAKENNLNIWKTTSTSDQKIEKYFYFILGIIMIVILLFSKKGRKKLTSELKKRLKKAIK